MATTRFIFVLLLAFARCFHAFSNRLTAGSGQGNLSVDSASDNSGAKHIARKESVKSLKTAQGEDDLPRVIWMLWFQGWEQAPHLQKQCLQSWQLYNPSWEVKAITSNDLPAVLEDDFEVYEKLKKDNADNFPMQAQSDLLRFLILKRHGGVWADSTMLCRRPLDEWLGGVMTAGFFRIWPRGFSILGCAFSTNCQLIHCCNS
jgi:mannosyltransferase OCH1-like enzyme